MSYARIQHGGGALPTTITGSMTSGTTSVGIAVSTGWPDGSTGPFYAVIDAGTASEEKVLITSRTSLTLNSLTRGSDGTSATSHSSGATIAHCFTATEADEANQIVNKTLGSVTAKGDMVVASGSGALGKQAAGADNTVFVYDSTQTLGVKGILLTESNLAASMQEKRGNYSGTTDSNGFVAFAHGASFTPVEAYFCPTGDGRATNVLMPLLFSMDGTNITLSHVAIKGTAIGVAVAGSYLVRP